MTKVDLVLASDADFIDIYDEIPRQPHVAFKCMINDYYTGVGGFIYNDDYDATIFLNIFDARYKYTIAKILIQKIKEFKQTSINFTVYRDITVKKSNIFLQKLGFRLLSKTDDNEIWELVHDNQKIHK